MGPLCIGCVDLGVGTVNKPPCVVQCEVRCCWYCIAICFILFSIMCVSLFDLVTAHPASNVGASSRDSNSSLAFRLHSFRNVLFASLRSYFAAILFALCTASRCGPAVTSRSGVLCGWTRPWALCPSARQLTSPHLLAVTSRSGVLWPLSAVTSRSEVLYG